VDDIERGALFVAQENAQKAIARLTRELNEIGSALKRFSSALESNPGSITFKNGPGHLGDQPASAHSPISYESYPDIEVIAKKIQELRQSRADLREIEQKLKEE
jgi:prefoldin subunit 5